MQGGQFSTNHDYPPPRASRRSAGNGAHGVGYDTESDSDKEQERGESDARGAPADDTGAGQAPGTGGTRSTGGLPGAGQGQTGWTGQVGGAQEEQAVSQLSNLVIVEPVPVRPSLVHPSPSTRGEAGSPNGESGEVAVVAQAYPVTVSADTLRGPDGHPSLDVVVRAYPLGPAPQAAVATAGLVVAAEQLALGTGPAAEGGAGGAGSAG